jgi:hypothetical protein
LCNLRCNQVKLLVIQIAWVTFGRVWCGSFGVAVADSSVIPSIEV